MSVYKGFYHDGIVEMAECPQIKERTEVLVIFPKKEKKISFKKERRKIKRFSVIQKILVIIHEYLNLS